jgi:hypothetical protein
MEKLNKFRNLLKIFLLVLISLILVGCPIRYYCGYGDFKCMQMLSTMPYAKPIKYETFNDIILLSDGQILAFDDHEITEPVSYDMKQICSTDTICDFEIYNHFLGNRIYDFGAPQSFPDSSDFILILTWDKCVKLDAWNSPVLEFGNSGTQATRLINAVSISINFTGEIFIADAGDNSIKKYDSNGNFITRFSADPPKQINIYEDRLFVLSNIENTIKAYDFDGSEIPVEINLDNCQNIIAFDLFDTDSMVLADNGGTRVSIVNFSGELMEAKHDYCFMDVNFPFGKITNIEYLYNDLFYCVDHLGQYILKFQRNFGVA